MGKFIKKKDIWSLSLCTLAILGTSQVLADTLVPVTEKNYTHST